MANFNTHLTVAFVCSSTASLMIYKAGMVSTSEFLCCALVGTVGGLLPDIDLDYSVPARVGFNILSMVVAFTTVILWINHLSIFELLLVWLLSYLTMQWGVFYLFSSLTVHRGMVHSVPYMAVISLTLVHISFYVFKKGTVFSWFLGVFLFFGAMIHLLLDEMYSVNLLGLTVKRSFGTAIKFFEIKNQQFYFLLYMIIAVMLFFAPPHHLFIEILTNPETLALLEKNLLPDFLANKTFDFNFDFTQYLP